ncbi:MAG: chemotaxis protein CheW [Clostridiaceae bacterium]|jgi:purine-binding chemotaxis protein CheW|nr:chemotaxis protein CheW [Clostridiaceae bacterium]
MASQYVVFKLDDERFAVEIERVLEIIHTQSVFKVPNSPPYIDGLINLRGKVYTLFNLRKKFELPSNEANTKESKVLIVNIDSNYIGMSVDAVNEIIQIEDSSIEETPPTLASNAKNYIKGVAKVNENLVLLLNLEALIESSSDIITSLSVK